MELKEWEIEKPRLLMALGKMEAWTATLLQSVEEAREMVEKANDDFMFKPGSHPVGVPDFEMTMRDIDGPLREILAIHQAIQGYYRENALPLNTGNLLEKADFTDDEITEVLALVQNIRAEGEAGDAPPIVCHITKGKIELQIEGDR
ncbi:MAG TPA: hypothetical protein VM821_08080 [Abditibacteriaceae bacterium]|nr:hypothetical protein [Abditibacteriaceae bacterium]